MKTGGIFVLIYILRQREVNGWIGPLKDPVSGSSYYISEERANEPKASRVCRLNGWILAKVLMKSEQETLERLADLAEIKDSIWIGLRLYQENGGYGVWSDGKPFNVSKKLSRYHNWHRTEPITFRTTTQIKRPTCVRLWSEQEWTWDDYYCDYDLAPQSRYACQAKDASKYRSSDLERISDDFIENTKQVEPSLSNLESLSNAMNEMLAVQKEFYEKNQTASREIVRSLDEFMTKYRVEKDGDFHANKTNVEIDIKEIKKNASLFVGERKDRTRNNFQIFLSSEVLTEAASRKSKTRNETADAVQVNAVLYRNPSLFQMSFERFATTFSETSNLTFKSRPLKTAMFGEEPSLGLLPILVTNVLSVDVKNVFMTKLKNPICVTNYDFFQNTTPPVIPDMIAKVSPICAFWDFDLKEWSTKGCRVLKPLEERELCGTMASLQNRSHRVTCVCDHMTHFSVLLDTTYIYAPKYLTQITIFGCTLSLICLLASIIIILVFKQLRANRALQILLQLCVSLLVINILFLAGIDKREQPLFCTVIAALLHYFLLTAWAWMFIEAIFLLLRLVVATHNNGIKGKIIPIGSTLAYGVPGLIAGLTVSVTPSNAYLSERYCWLAMPVLIPSLLVPIGMILFTNFAIFGSVLYTITFKSKIFRKRVNAYKIRQTMTRALCMMFILGIPWLFGFFMLLAQAPATKETFAVCFTVFNTTQGVFIFFFFCARREQVKKLWLIPLSNKFTAAVRHIHSLRQRRRCDSKSRQLVDKSETKYQTDDEKAGSITNERSLVTFPGSQSTFDTNTNSINSRVRSEESRSRKALLRR